MFKTRRISYGGTAAVVTSTALISGLSAANATKPIIVSALLIAALADNLTDALSVHIFQESEQLTQKDAFTATTTNFVTRLLLCASFVPLVAFFPLSHATVLAILWAALLLGALTYMVARERNVKPMPEVVKHLFVASVAIIASTLIGHWIGAALS
jgi:VIT1/CCC1 family predicted Fe2+/Mn2+ transporter